MHHAANDNVRSALAKGTSVDVGFHRNHLGGYPYFKKHCNIDENGPMVGRAFIAHDQEPTRNGAP